MNQSPTPRPDTTPNSLDRVAFDLIADRGHQPLMTRVALVVEYMDQHGVTHTFTAGAPGTNPRYLVAEVGGLIPARAS